MGNRAVGGFSHLKTSATPHLKMRLESLGSGFRVQGLGFRVQGLGFRVPKFALNPRNPKNPQAETP